MFSKFWDNILQVLWFFYVAALILSAGLIVYRHPTNLVLTFGHFWHFPRFAVYISPKLRCWILLSCRLAKTKRVYHGVQNLTVRYFASDSISLDVLLQYMSWFWLFQIKNNTDDAVFDDILYCLFDSSDKRVPERYLFLSFKTDVNFWEHVVGLFRTSAILGQDDIEQADAIISTERFFFSFNTIGIFLMFLTKLSYYV